MDAPPPLPAQTLPRFTLILPAAGGSTRFGSNKLLASLAGEPVIARTISAFLDHPSLAGIVIAASQPNAIRQRAYGCSTGPRPRACRSRSPQAAGAGLRAS
jgi:CTP:molybdopterin cytidylyltransferase MocA